MPEQLRNPGPGSRKLVDIGKLRIRYRNGILYQTEITEKEKNGVLIWRELNRIYMGYRDLLDRVGELEALLKAPEIKISLNCTRLHFIALGNRERAKQCEDLANLIKKTLGD